MSGATSSMGSNLPLVFANGQPAVLHNMTLAQLRKFVPFLIKCDTNQDLPSEDSNNNNDSPAWWPDEIPFCASVLTEKVPRREAIDKLLSIVSRCYAYHKASYVIAFSSSLGKNLQQEKLAFLELGDGTTRVLNSRGQLVVVIRTNTRFYDRDEMSARTNGRSTRTRLSSPDVDGTADVVATDFKKSFFPSPKLTRIDDTRLKNGSYDLRQQPAKTAVAVRKVVDDITNQLKLRNNNLQTSNRVVIKPTSKKLAKISASKRSSAKAKVTSANISEIYRCKYCSRSFNLVHLFEDHEDVCNLGPDSDIRERAEMQDCYASFLGLERKTTPAKVTKPQFVGTPTPAPPLQTTARTLRKVASRSKIGTFIRRQPLPLTCFRGQEFLKKFGERVKPREGPCEYEKYCLSSRTQPPACTPPVATLKKHKLKDGAYAHFYAMGSNQRRVRGVELVMGLSTRSFRLLNQCKDFSLPVDKLPEKTFKIYMNKINKQKEKKKLLLIDLMKKCSPQIRLTDIVKFPKALPVQYRKILNQS